MIRLLLLLALALPQEKRFVAYDVVVDASRPLAAWQVELTATGDAKIVGVAGGDAGVWANPPYHDAAALQGGKIVLGAFTTEVLRLYQSRTPDATVADLYPQIISWAAAQ